MKMVPMEKTQTSFHSPFKRLENHWKTSNTDLTNMIKFQKFQLFHRKQSKGTTGKTLHQTSANKNSPQDILKVCIGFE